MEDEEIPFLTRNVACSLLDVRERSIFIEADHARPWAKQVMLDNNGLLTDFNDRTYRELWDKGLMRICDRVSGIPGPDRRIFARDCRRLLNTREARVETLTIQPNNADWRPTPYLSFTNSPHALQKLADKRLHEGNRGAQFLVVVDPRSRLKKGLPILNFGAEARHYGIQLPPGTDYSFHDDHYLCLWEVTPEELVGCWRWDQLRTDPDWYTNVVCPALLQHQAGQREQVAF